jgi:hypothetical protein
MSNFTLQRLVTGMIRAFGDRAHEEALKCAGRFAEINDTEGEEIWKEIADEITRYFPPQPQVD